MSKAVIFFAPGLEECEGLLCVDILRRAGVEVTIAAVGGEKIVKSARQISVVADALAEELDYTVFDACILPGGIPGVPNLKADATVRRVCRDFAAEGKVVAAICAAPTALAAFGVLNGKKATVYPGMDADLTAAGASYTGLPLTIDGSIVTEAEPRTFFSGNSFYTTSANRIARDVLPEAVTPEDVIAACGGAVAPEPALPEYQRIPPAPEKEAQVLKKLPVWRKALAAVSGIVSLVLMIQAIGVTDLTKLVDAGGLTGLAGSQMRLYGILLLSLLVFALSIGRKADRPDYLIQTPVEKRKLRNRTIFATALILLLIPLTLFIGVYCFGGKRYYFISLLILLECMLPFFLIFEGRKPQARELVLIAVLVALNVAGRAAFFMLPEFKPVVAMTILAGVAFGGETGFLVGAMTMLVSNMLFSQGPWTPWQMFAMGSIGWLAGVLYRKGVLRRLKLSLCIFGVIASTVIFGGIMNPASALMWSESVNWKIIMSYYITGIPVDLVRAVATLVFLWLGAEPMLEKLDRVKTKYGLAE